MLPRARSLVSTLLLFALYGQPARADRLRILSDPPGATVEVEGKTGTTPFEADFPGGYFRPPLSLFSTRLSHPMMARITLEGYTSKEITLTEGPKDWISSNGHKRYPYYLFRSLTFHVKLEPIGETFDGEVEVGGGESRERTSKLTKEEVVQNAKLAVVHLKGQEKQGSGFFVTDTGVIATNAHLARDEESLTAVLASGQQLPVQVVYIDSDLDVALLKAKGTHFPHLTLAEAGSVEQGEDVIAVGNPGGGMAFSVTKGIVSAVGKFAPAGPGTWIQTDASINPGNSGGPLVNARGEAIGISTQKLVKEDVSGIGFALSSSDLLTVLRRFYPKKVEMEGMSAEKKEDARVGESSEGVGTVEFKGVAGAEIEIDGQFVGDIPSTVKVSAGRHTIVVKGAGHADWTKVVTVTAGSRITLQPPWLP